MLVAQFLKELPAAGQVRRRQVVAQFLKELPAAGQVRRRQAAMVPDEIVC